MKLRSLRAGLVIACLALAACAGPRSEVEVYHLRDLVREGKVEYLSELVVALGSTDETVRSSAIRSLAELGEVAEPRLRQTVSEKSERSAAAMLALGFGGNPDNLEFIRGFMAEPGLSAPAKEAEREIEHRLATRAQAGEVEAMEQYLEAFPDSPRSEEFKKIRRIRLAKQSWERVSAAPTVSDLEEYLRVYGDTEDAPMAKATLARLLVREVNVRIDQQDFAGAREIANRVVQIDARREEEAQRLVAQAWLLEGRALRQAGKDEQALAALEQAGKHPDFRLDADRARADILMVQARARLQAGAIREGVTLADRAAQIDIGRRNEVSAIKSELALSFQSKIQGTDPVQRRMALVGLLALGDEAARPMELYLGSQFAKKDYASVEEVVQALAEAKRGTPADLKNPGVDRVGELLVGYLRTALAASTSDMQRLFSSPEFMKHWNNEINPVDPREFPLIYRVEELSSRHLGLSRVGLGAKALLGETGLDIRGGLLTEEELRNRLQQGQIGNDPALPLLHRVQLSARFSAVMGEFSRSVQAKPDRFMAYAVGLNIPPTTAGDWLQVAEGYREVTARNAQVTGRIPASSLAGGLRDGQTSMVSLDFDQRSLTLQVYDPVVDRLGGQSPDARSEAMSRTLAILMNTARIAFGLYAGIDRYTLLVGATEAPASNDAPVRGGRFDPETRMMMSQKSFGKIDWQRIRSLNGVYGPTEAASVDLQWNRWTR